MSRGSASAEAGSVSPERVGRHIGGGHEPEDERVERERRDRLREALSYWTTGVSILAVREGAPEGDGGVHALTVGAFLPVSIDPPLVLTSLGPNASALPYLDPGTRYVITVLGREQRGIAARYADTFPVGPSPFPDSGDPRVGGGIASFVCVVEEMLERGDHTLVFGRVVEAESGVDEEPLAYFRRGYRSIDWER